MINQSAVVFCLTQIPGCPLQMLMRKTVESSLNETNNTNNSTSNSMNIVLNMVSGIAGRVLRAGLHREEGYTEIWLRISGASGYLDLFENKMRQEEGVAFQKIFSNKFNTVYRILIEHNKCPCANDKVTHCPLLKAMPGAMVKSSIITPYGLLCEFLVAKSRVISELKQRGCKILLMHEINGYDFMLTQKQELAIIYAYLMGYYHFPRKVSLKELAAKLGLSVSTLAELLRKAEAKVIDAYIRHELPHYLVGLVMSKSTYRDFVENQFGSKHEEKKEKVLVEAKTS